MWSSSTCGCGCNKACKIDEYLDIKNYSREKRLIGRLALKCEDVILNATKTSLDDKKSITRKYNCFIHTISLVNIYLLLLVVISIGFYYYYTRDWIKKEHVVSH